MTTVERLHNTALSKMFRPFALDFMRKRVPPKGHAGYHMTRHPLSSSSSSLSVPGTQRKEEGPQGRKDGRKEGRKEGGFLRTFVHEKCYLLLLLRLYKFGNRILRPQWEGRRGGGLTTIPSAEVFQSIDSERTTELLSETVVRACTRSRKPFSLCRSRSDPIGAFVSLLRLIKVSAAPPWVAIQ